MMGLSMKAHLKELPLRKRIARRRSADRMHYVRARNGRYYPVARGGMVDVALSELGARLVEVDCESGRNDAV